MGILAGSTAAAMMSGAAVASGTGGVVAESLVAVMQSIGVVGLSADLGVSLLFGAGAIVAVPAAIAVFLVPKFLSTDYAGGRLYEGLARNSTCLQFLLGCSCSYSPDGKELDCGGINPFAINQIRYEIQQRTTAEAAITSEFVDIYNILNFDAQAIKVAVRIRNTNSSGKQPDASNTSSRPATPEYELNSDGSPVNCMALTGSNKIDFMDPKGEKRSKSFVFDAVFGMETDQEVVYGVAHVKERRGKVDEASGNCIDFVIKVSYLEIYNEGLVDLLVDKDKQAGSERADSTGATENRLKEGAQINQSLSALGNVISALTSPTKGSSKQHIPYRDSKLTYLLSDSLGGNALTLMITCCSPTAKNYSESISTLRFAERVKKVVNKAVVNMDRNLLRIAELEAEVLALKARLKAGVDGDSKKPTTPQVEPGTVTETLHDPLLIKIIAQLEDK
ncbi:UNVERIFIED_CONTAM: Kinesin-like protein kif1b, partial [Siphonaria sp. JEL0065]